MSRLADGQLLSSPAPGGSVPSADDGAGRESGFWASTRLVAQREITTQIRGKSFWITFGVLVLALVAGAVLPGLIGGGDDAPTVAVVGQDAARAVQATDLQARVVDSLDEARELVRSGDVDAAVVGDPGSATGLRVIALNEVPLRVAAALVQTPEVDLLEPGAPSEAARYMATFVFALVFFMFTLSGIGIAQSIVIEKQTRIVEILAATVPVRALLTGKIVAFSLLTFGQVAVLAIVAPIALRAGEQQALLSLIAPGLGWFVPFFVLGYVLLAAMWAAAGALVSRMEDLGSSSSLVMLLVMLPYFGVIFFQRNELVMTILSYVPFSAAVAMPVRMFSDDPQPWEPIVSLGLLAATLVTCILVASRIYTGALLQTGARVRLSRAWAGAETP
ncbi:MAG: ABC transporter permease [Micromonosporaceae bacterium]|nr:ABC transporter permease [Micromonosporaceae bacterium]